MTQFQAGKTYPLFGGGQGEIFVTKDGKHWGRMLTKHETDWHHAVPSSWEENGNRPFDETGKFTLIAPPTTITLYANICKEPPSPFTTSALGFLYKDPDDAFYAASLKAIHKAIPIHITTHSDGRIEIKGGTE